MARRDDQARGGVALAEGGERPQHRLLFPFDGAAGDPQRARLAAILPQRATQRGRRHRLAQRVVLEVARDVDALRRSAHLQHPRAMRVGLHQEQVDLRQDVAQQRPCPPVARERAGRDTSVDHGDAGAAPPREMNEVRPDLGLHQHEQGRIQPVEDPRHRAGEVEGSEEDAVGAAQGVPRHRVPGERGRGDEHAMTGEKRLQRRNEDPRRQHLTHGDGVDPDRRSAGRRHVVGHPPHAIGQRPQVLPRAAALPQVERGGDGERDGQEEAVEKVHQRAEV